MKFLAYGPHGSENAAVIDGDRPFDLRPLIGEARVVDRAFLEAIQDEEKRRAVIELLKGVKR